MEKTYIPRVDILEEMAEAREGRGREILYVPPKGKRIRVVDRAQVNARGQKILKRARDFLVREGHDTTKKHYVPKLFLCEAHALTSYYKYSSRYRVAIGTDKKFMQPWGFSVLVCWDAERNYSSVGDTSLDLADIIDLANHTLWKKQLSNKWQPPEGVPFGHRYQLEENQVLNEMEERVSSF